jgi:ABC-type multidrug transport system ATPase subunit
MAPSETSQPWTSETLDVLSDTDPKPLKMRDRSAPLWALGLSFLFSGGAAVCLVAAAVFILFLQDLVAIQGQEIMALLLALGGIVPVLGLIVFEVGHTKALAGYRHLRLRNAAFGQMCVAVVVIGALALLSPLLAIPFAAGAVLCWLVIFPLSRVLPKERLWEFLPTEAVSFLSGRDHRALQLANQPGDSENIEDTLVFAIRLLSAITMLSLSSWLVAREILSLSAVASVTVLQFWALGSFARYLKSISRLDPELQERAASVTILPPSTEPGDRPLLEDGLSVRDLSVSTPGGPDLLAEVSFDLSPGDIIGVNGDEFAGKTTLLRALSAPHDLTDLTIRGSVTLAGENPWLRSAQDREVQTVLVSSSPLLVPGTGADNLACFLPDDMGARARRLLKSLVHNSDTVAHICGAKDVRVLSSTDQKALAFARALFLRPRLYLLDRPEDGASAKLLDSLAARLEDEARLGAIFVIATEDRRLLEKCNKMLMLQNGRLIELAPSEEVVARKSTGWVRFVSERDLDREDALDSWVCAQFRRDGDEGNRRTVCLVANEMLALACQRQPHQEVSESVTFEFKHFKGHCILRIVEKHLPVSSAALEHARAQAVAAGSGGSLSPLARIVKNSRSVELIEITDRHTLQVEIETYDPRNETAPGASRHETHPG